MNVLKGLVVIAIAALLAAPAVYWLSPSLFLRAAVALERADAGLSSQQLAIPGFSLRYLDSGGAGAPLLLVHGFGGDKDNWTRLAKHLGDDIRVIAPDLPGYGRSDAPIDADYGLDAQVERLRMLIERLGLTRVHVGGNSMGGNIAARFAARYPNQVGSLWLIANSGVASAPQSELRRQIAEGRPNPLVATTRAEYRELLGWVMAQPPTLPDALVDVLADRAIAAHTLRQRQFEQLYAQTDPLEQVLDGLPVPTHIVWGAQDRVLHAGAVEVLRKLLPQASHTVLDGIGHLPMVEAPEATAQDYLEFRMRLATGATAAR
ncbi:alpha/beta fold hydrolase [Panacagrimonas sp.]|uniref:alpha/beta fold hydrolase n=1 Tax=Panacagrimonas sp. TaxID=2480088 RepID=UPI003B52B919